MMSEAFLLEYLQNISKTLFVWPIKADSIIYINNAKEGIDFKKLEKN